MEQGKDLWNDPKRQIKLPRQLKQTVKPNSEYLQQEIAKHQALLFAYFS